MEGRDEPGLVVNSQFGDLNQTTTKNAPEKAQNTQQLTKDLLKYSTSCGLKAVKAVEVLPWVTACEKHYKTILMSTILFYSGL